MSTLGECGCTDFQWCPAHEPGRYVSERFTRDGSKWCCRDCSYTTLRGSEFAVHYACEHPARNKEIVARMEPLDVTGAITRVPLDMKCDRCGSDLVDYGIDICCSDDACAKETMRFIFKLVGDAFAERRKRTDA